MIAEKSCGAVVFTKEDGNIKYIIIQSKEGIYGFPKGHTEEAESETETALREVAEETGLFVDLIHGFRAEDTHTFNHNGKIKTKHIIYFLAEYTNQVPTAQKTELNSIHLMRFEDAISVFQFNGSKRILTEAHNFLMQL